MSEGLRPYRSGSSTSYSDFCSTMSTGLVSIQEARVWKVSEGSLVNGILFHCKCLR